jgi:hypothetical protein
MINTPISPTTRCHRRLWEKTNWDKYDKIILESLKNPSQPKSALDVAMLAVSIAEILQKAINLAVPSITPKRRSVAWWTLNLTILRKKLIQSKSRLRQQFLQDKFDQCQKFEKAWPKAAKLLWDKRLATVSHQIFGRQLNR